MKRPLDELLSEEQRPPLSYLLVHLYLHLLRAFKVVTDSLQANHELLLDPHTLRILLDYVSLLGAVEGGVAGNDSLVQPASEPVTVDCLQIKCSHLLNIEDQPSKLNVLSLLELDAVELEFFSED